MSSTAGSGRGRRSWWLGRTSSHPEGTSRWHSDFPFAARVRSQHRGRTGLRQESRDRTKNSGLAHRTG